MSHIWFTFDPLHLWKSNTHFTQESWLRRQTKGNISNQARNFAGKDFSSFCEKIQNQIILLFMDKMDHKHYQKNGDVRQNHSPIVIITITRDLYALASAYKRIIDTNHYFAPQKVIMQFLWFKISTMLSSILYYTDIT